MSGEPTWRVQAHWRVDTETRSYAPVFAASEAEALASADEIAATLAHFPTLEVRVERVDPAIAATEIEAQAERALRRKRPTLHVFNAAHTGTVCGVELDLANAAVTSDLLARSDGDKCSHCLSILGVDTD